MQRDREEFCSNPAGVWKSRSVLHVYEMDKHFLGENKVSVTVI